MPALREHQRAALNRLIAGIVPGNRFYQRKLAACAALEGFDSLGAFSDRMPFTTKEELARDQQENPPYGSALTHPIDRYTRHHQTSGTSGRPMVWLDDNASWQWILDNWKIVWKQAGGRAGDVAFFPFSFGPFLGFWAAFDSAVQLGIRSIPGGGMSTADRLRLLFEQRPRFLCCTPTYALRLAEVARQEAMLLRDSGVECLIVAGEPGGSIPEIRGRIQEVWTNARIVDHHGMTEVGAVSYGDAERPTWLRLIHESYYCEVLQPGTAQPAEPGECGELVLTTLGREACPLLRYRTGDLVKPVAVPGEDTDAFALEGGVLGRVDDMVIVRGVNLYPGAVDAVVRRVAGVREYQVEVDKRPTLPEVTVRYETENGVPDPADALARELRTAFQMRITVERAEPQTLPVFEMKSRRWRILV